MEWRISIGHKNSIGIYIEKLIFTNLNNMSFDSFSKALDSFSEWEGGGGGLKFLPDTSPKILQTVLACRDFPIALHDQKLVWGVHFQ